MSAWSAGAMAVPATTRARGPGHMTVEQPLWSARADLAAVPQQQQPQGQDCGESPGQGLQEQRADSMHGIGHLKSELLASGQMHYAWISAWPHEGQQTSRVDGQMQCIAEGTWQLGQAIEQDNSEMQSTCTIQRRVCELSNVEQSSPGGQKGCMHLLLLSSSPATTAAAWHLSQPPAFCSSVRHMSSAAALLEEPSSTTQPAYREHNRSGNTYVLTKLFAVQAFANLCVHAGA